MLFSCQDCFIDLYYTILTVPLGDADYIVNMTTQDYSVAKISV